LISIVMKEWKAIGHYYHVTFQVRSNPYNKIADSLSSNCNRVFFHPTEFIDLQKK
jgi:hypothetical protein